MIVKLHSLRQFGYSRLGKADRGIIKAYLEKVGGLLSHAQVTRLIRPGTAGGFGTIGGCLPMLFPGAILPGMCRCWWKRALCTALSRNRRRASCASGLSRDSVIYITSDWPISRTAPVQPAQLGLLPVPAAVPSTKPVLGSDRRTTQTHARGPSGLPAFFILFANSHSI